MLGDCSIPLSSGLGISTVSERVVLKREVRNQVTESLTNRTKEFGLYSVDKGSS